MAFEKAKVLKAAEKFLSQGKISSAIKEYRLLVEHDKSDLTALNMLGDLCVRASRTDEAIDCFQRIAEHYSEQQFTLKAIAMYKKIDRLKPRDPHIANKLATLYGSQGLVVDARAQYLIVADAYSRAGESGKALEIFHKIADLDPHNTEIRLKLAEGYVKENMRVEAANAFVEAARRFYDTRGFEKSLDAYSKALKLVPGENGILRGLLSVHVALGTADEMAELLEHEVEERPDDRELLILLVEAYLEADDPRGAEQAAMRLTAVESSDYIYLIAVAKLYLNSGEIEETVRVLTGIVEQMLAGREETELLGIVNEVLARNPDQVGALRLLVKIQWWQRDQEALRETLERMAEAAQAAELPEEERYALTQLVRLAPDEQKFRERLDELGGLQDEEAVESLPQQDQFGEVPEFESFAPGGFEITVPVETQNEPAWEVMGAEGHVDPSASFADLSDTATITFDEFETHRAEETISGSPPPKVAAKSPDTDDAARREKMLLQELESVDFYISQGYNDIAIDTLDMLGRQFGSHSEIQARRDRLNSSPQTSTTSPEVFEFSPADELVNGKDAVAVETESSSFDLVLDPLGAAENQLMTPMGTGIDPGLAEIFEEFRIAAEEEQQPSEREDFETHYNMGTAYKEMDLLDEAIHEFQTAASLSRPGDGSSRFLQCCTMLGHCFVQKDMPRAAVMWFQKGLDARGSHEEEQKALRYELAAVFEHMGDLDEAHNLYSQVYGVDVGYREVSTRLRQLEERMQNRRSRKRRKTDEP